MMKQISCFVLTMIFIASISSCASVDTIPNSENEVAGYTLKNKKELMQQKVLNKKNKTIIALP